MYQSGFEIQRKCRKKAVCSSECLSKVNHGTRRYFWESWSEDGWFEADFRLKVKDVSSKGGFED